MEWLSSFERKQDDTSIASNGCIEDRVLTVEVGRCHPPVGLNLYVASSITRMGITELTIAVWPWLLTMLVFLIMVTYMPIMSLWLPKMLGMM